MLDVYGPVTPTAAGGGGMVWYGIVEFNVPLDTVFRRHDGDISEGEISLSSDVHLSFSNGGPAT